MFSRLPLPLLSLLSLLPLLPSAIAQAPGQAPAQAAQAPTGNRRPAAEELQRPPDLWRAGFDSIQAGQCRKWLTQLAGDEMEGRGTGYPGFERAARWVAARFAEFGLEPVGDDKSYFQRVPFESRQVASKKSWLALQDDEGEELLRVKVGEGLSGSIREASTMTKSLVFVCARSGEDIDPKILRGKAVIFFDQSEVGPYGRTKGYIALRRSRPGAVLVIDEARAKTDPASSKSVRYAGRKNNRSGRWRRPNEYAITPEVARKLLGRAGLTLKLDKDTKGGTTPLADFSIQAHIELETGPAFACNVVGMIRGSDPKLSAEIVGIGSHLDHLGKRGTTIYPGADDDGSGTTGLLAVARAFSLNKLKPKRSLLFMAFCGKELGLIGSNYYVEHPIFENSRMVAEFQMDMIGRNEEHARSGEKAADNVNSLHLVGSKKLSDDLHRICLKENDAYTRFAFEYDEENVFHRSDHKNFARKDIPIAFFFTGFHPQYHQPTDTVDRIDFPKLARVARLVYSIAWTTAEREQRPKVDRTYAEILEAEGGQRQRRRRR